MANKNKWKVEGEFPEYKISRAKKAFVILTYRNHPSLFLFSAEYIVEATYKGNVIYRIGTLTWNGALGAVERLKRDYLIYIMQAQEHIKREKEKVLTEKEKLASDVDGLEF